MVIVRIVRSFAMNIVEEREIFVRVAQTEPEGNKNIRMQVGVKDALHIEFEYSRSRFPFLFFTFFTVFQFTSRYSRCLFHSFRLLCFVQISPL
jgi:hypothetical protein